MKLGRVILTKSDLAALPQTERSLLLLLGHASNEINVLSKLILVVTRKDAPPSRLRSGGPSRVTNCLSWMTGTR